MRFFALLKGQRTESWLLEPLCADADEELSSFDWLGSNMGCE
jgi:hypothetical protein